MTDSTTPQDSAAMPPASAGSVGEPAAWVLECAGWPARFFKGDERQYAVSIKRPQDTLSPLYRQPKPTLTDAEREAMEWAGGNDWWTDRNTPTGDRHAATLRGLLDRTK